MRMFQTLIGYGAMLLTAVLLPGSVKAQELRAIDLPAPQLEAGKPLMTALSERRTTREFKPGMLPRQELANLLWAACGINRPPTGHRTVPSAMNSQEVDLYVALPEGLYLYEPKPHRLAPVLPGDFRGKTSGQTFAKDAAVVLVYVADLPRLAKAKPETRPFYAGIDAGCMVQNVYLYCASAGLGSVVYDLDRPPLAEAMHLRTDQSIVLAHAIGFPKPETPSAR